jgi:hypothetical protein
MSADSGGVVLAAVDGSPETADAVDVAAQLARAWNCGAAPRPRLVGSRLRVDRCHR